MHPNPVFRQATLQENLAIARQRSFGILSLNGDRVPLFAHVPFRLSDDGSSLSLHLVRSNPICRQVVENTRAVVVVSGPDGYVSPDWYGAQNLVPTWNYVAVDLTGRLERRPDSEILSVVDELSAQFEQRLLPKPPWKSAKMTPDVLRKMLGEIVPFRLHIEAVDGTRKLGQNKPETARLGAAEKKCVKATSVRKRPGWRR